MAGVRPFLESVLEGVKIPQARFDDVLHHYEAFNGVSLYNEITRRQQQELEKWFLANKKEFPVYIGLRHASPTFCEAFQIMKRDGFEKVIGFILSPFRCFASFEKYVKKVEEGKTSVGASFLKMEYTNNFFDHPLFLEAQADKITLRVNQLSQVDREQTFYVFSAHSIPVPMSDQSGYADQFLKASSLTAKKLGLIHWDCGYQSRSGNPRDPWLVPDVKEIIQKLDNKKFTKVMFIPIGFLCDNVEVLYDLDVEAKEIAEKAGFGYFRASTVTDHPKFIEMIGTQVLQTMDQGSLCK